jgi:hypothetical protein
MSPRTTPETSEPLSYPPMSQAAVGAIGTLFFPDPDSPIDDGATWDERPRLTQGTQTIESENRGVKDTTLRPHSPPIQQAGSGADRNLGKRRAPTDDDATASPVQGTHQELSNPVTDDEQDRYIQALKRDKRGSASERQAWPPMETLVSHTNFSTERGIDESP